jgi:hypothetical protein
MKQLLRQLFTAGGGEDMQNPYKPYPVRIDDIQIATEIKV